MPVPFSSLTSRKEIESSVADGGAGDESMPTTHGFPSGNGDEVEREKNGQFATGHRALVTENTGTSKAKGIVSLIKAKTKNYETLIDNLLTISRGKELYGKKPGLKDILDATNSLLDRSIGKPTQQVLHTGDDIAKELLATRQEALRLQKAEAARKADERKVAPDVVAEGQVSSLQAMREQGRVGS